LTPTAAQIEGFTAKEIDHMAKPNYAFQKRQRELAKKQKKEAKLKQRAAEHAPPPEPGTEATDASDVTSEPPKA
jgi:hypothetical protein